MSQLNPVLVCVTGQKTCGRLIQKGGQLAKELGLPLDVIHVAHPGAPLLGNQSESEALNYLYALSNEAGAEMTMLRAEDPLESIIQYAKDHHAPHIVLGAGPMKQGTRDFAKLIQMRVPKAQVHVVMA